MTQHLQKMLLTMLVLVLVALLARMMIVLRGLEERVWLLEQRQPLSSYVTMAEDSVPTHILPSGETVSVPHETPVAAAQGVRRPAAPAYIPPPSERPRREVVSSATTSASAEPLPEQNKFSQPHLLDLNLLDSATLVRVPGIAGRTATTILSYRERLGGFYHPRQLSERLTWEGAQQRMDEWCTQWFVADTTRIVRLQVNKLPFRDLLRHPYLEYAQVQDLVRYRDRNKRIPDLSALRQMPSFTEADILRLSHYLSFE